MCQQFDLYGQGIHSCYNLNNEDGESVKGNRVPAAEEVFSHLIDDRVKIAAIEWGRLAHCYPLMADKVRLWWGQPVRGAAEECSGISAVVIQYTRYIQVSSNNPTTYPHLPCPPPVCGAHYWTSSGGSNDYLNRCSDTWSLIGQVSRL